MNSAIQLPQIAIRIIREQELIIGPLAWDEARKVQGLQIVDEKRGEVSLQNGDPKNVIDKLVAQYERIFGRASHAVCHDAVQDLIATMSPEEIPSSLK
ncbi:hypothetical protein A2917_02830 [Candidatus Nomurabacteria bacterium RIFCSPLOWO2_01_FULL_42_17]|uniref:Uncharacterized protein n=1 Tax=Candidatus Nomurabacteria bacterium RIFCSPLOWO2_01_FULL_42_17 TaxID=1801780 RepID=A0A1F6XMU2_9BACT|nr:MAG: hypothetical protein A2917_02830 [Candidatus Nomurabacteria bacterium RIFCSPLOWO2_01_FULL_42_17]